VAEALIAAAQSASTSSHKQLWSVVSVQQPERKETMALLCGDQVQIRTCGLFLAFLADHYRLKKAATEAGENPDALPTNEMYTMAVIDAALAAERLVCAAEVLGYGVCYIGALRNKPWDVKEFLDLPEGVVGVFGLAIGVVDPSSSAAIKPRFSQRSVCFEEVYNRDPDIAEFDARMKPFYEGQGMKGEHTWSSRNGRGTMKGRMSGREAFSAFIREQGMDLE
jgi:nitroreductase